MTSSQISRVPDRSFMPGRNPRISWLPAPRPVPNSKRPSREVVEHRHTLGDLGRVVHLRERVEDARADVDALVALREVPADHVVGREVRVLVEEVVLGEPHVLEPGAVGGLDRGELVHERSVLGLGIVASPERRVVSLDEQPELHGPEVYHAGAFMVW